MSIVLLCSTFCRLIITHFDFVPAGFERFFQSLDFHF